MVLKLLPLLLAGCIKRPEPVRADPALDVAVAAVVANADDGGSANAPQEAFDQLFEVLRARNLEPRMVAVTPSSTDPGDPRVFEVLGVDDADLLLHVEASARFFSQMNGRYRWTVQVWLRLAPAGSPPRPIEDRFEVPVFLQYDHEDEDEAMVGALPIIERRLGLLLDQHLRGLAPQGG